jgi:hypothetical protein
MQCIMIIINLDLILINYILKEEIFNLNFKENEIITKLRCEH